MSHTHQHSAQLHLLAFLLGRSPQPRSLTIYKSSLAFVALCVLTQACGFDIALPTGPPTGSGSGSGTGTGTSVVDAGPTGFVSTCAGDGTGDFVLNIESLPYRDSGRAYVAVIEDFGSGADGYSNRARTVYLAGDVVGGKLTLRCDNTLRATSYPSVGVYLDTNGDGRCSDGDLGLVPDGSYLYMWDGSDQSFSVRDRDWQNVSAAAGTPQGASVGSVRGFCASFFPDAP